MVWQTGKAEKKRYACHALRKDITPHGRGFLKALHWSWGSTEGEREEVTGRRLGPLEGEREGPKAVEGRTLGGSWKKSGREAEEKGGQG